MHVGMVKKLFASARKRGDLVFVGDKDLAFAIEVGIDLGFDGFAVEVVRHEFLIDRPVLQAKPGKVLPS